MKRILAIFVCFVMTFMLMPEFALADKASDYEAPEITKDSTSSSSRTIRVINKAKLTTHATTKSETIDFSILDGKLHLGANNLSTTYLAGIYKLPSVLATWNTWTNSSNKIQSLINCALAQTGKTGSDLGYSTAWCAMFISSCASKVGIADNVIPNPGNTKKSLASSGKYYGITYAWGLGQVIVDYYGGRYLGTGESPQAGDLVVFHGDHIGIMIDSLNCVSGNLGGKVVKCSVSDCIKWNSASGWSTSNTKYVRPNYGTCVHTFNSVGVCTKCGFALIKFDPYSAKQSIGSTNATIAKTISVSSIQISSVTSVGFMLCDAQGNQLKDASGNNIKKMETPIPSGSVINAWYNINTELNYILKPSTRYYYKFLALVNGSLYDSGVQYFDTSSVSVNVSFNANGGDYTPNSMTVNTGSGYGTLPTVSRNGFNFTGWYTAQSGGNQVTSGTTVSNATNHTLYAQWSQINSTITVGSIERLSATRVSSTSIKLTWRKALNATGYHIYRSSSADGTYAYLRTIYDSPLSYMLFTNTGLVNGRTYYYKVCAFNKVGTIVTKGAMSNYVFAKTY